MAASLRIIGTDTELDKILNRDFVTAVRSGYVEVGKDNFCLPIYYKEYEEKIRNFQVKDDDVFLAAHPKTGTTWAQEMIWLIMNNLDYEEASRHVIYKRFPQLEFPILFDLSPVNLNEPDFFDDPYAFIVNLKSPRCIKTHLHWSLLPEQIRNGTKKPKIITILRNAEDTCVSLYYQSKIIEGYKGEFEDFAKLFLGGRVCFGPFWKQVLSYWQQKDAPNILFIKYKDMKNDLPGVILKVAKFLNKDLTKEQVEKLAEHLSFDSMKKNSAVNHEEVIEAMKKYGVATEEGNSFIRKGEVGGYKSVMSPELIQKFQKWTEENLKGTDLCID